MNCISTKVSLLLFMCLLSISALAQFELENKITDFASFAPIEGASVYVQNTTIGTITNVDGKFSLKVPQKHAQDTLVISSIGYRSFKSLVSEFDNNADIFLDEDVASLDEILIVAETRPKTGNDIVLRALEELPENLPDSSYIQKGFLRHKERNKNEYKWLIESAITVYDSSYAAGAKNNLKINIDETRKSYDLREIDSLFAYTAYLKNRKNNRALKSKNLRRDTIATASLVKAIKWNDERINGLSNLLKGKLNLVRNANASKAVFGEGLLNNHQFRLDTVLVENERKIYKIEILKGEEFVGLGTTDIYNEGFEANGWLYIYWDNFAIKKIEYQLVAASDVQKRRSKSLYGTQVNHTLTISYKEYNEKMYPNYISYETPKLVNVGDRSSDKPKDGEPPKNDKNTLYYFTTQEIVFTEIIEDKAIIEEAKKAKWSDDIFLPRPYNKDFWENYNVLLESEEEDKLIKDLSRRASLFKE